MRRCLVFLEDIPSVQIQTKSFDGHFSGVLSDNGVVIAEAKIFKKLLDEKLVKWSDFSMVILELGVDYYKERKYKNLYKQITESYHKVKASLPKAQLMPQVSYAEMIYTDKKQLYICWKASQSSLLNFYVF